ncbi:hypothetical protein GCM10010377_16890 [Streptomyces viridiviolaceus]|nr:hypothetical protein GCM10010377_16890 [Streptomyces viridiviolaceus]
MVPSGGTEAADTRTGSHRRRGETRGGGRGPDPKGSRTGGPGPTDDTRPAGTHAAPDAPWSRPAAPKRQTPAPEATGDAVKPAAAGEALTPRAAGPRGLVRAVSWWSA